jgi:chromosome segregation ATPase
LVRSITQQGSNNDIAKDLEAFRTDVAATIERRSMKSDVPEAFLGLAEKLVDQLWTGAIEQARAELEDERRTVHAERDAALAEADRTGALLQAAKDDQSAMQARHDRQMRELQARLDEQVQATQDALSQVAGLTARAGELEESVREWQQNTESERAAREAQERRFTEEMAAQRQQHEKASQDAEGTRKHILLQLDQARTTERDLRDQLRDARAELHLQAERFGIERGELQRRAEDSAAKAAVLTGENRAQATFAENLKTRIRELEQLLFDRSAEHSSAAGSIQEKIKEARFSPNIREYCDSYAASVKGEVNQSTGATEVWIENDEGEVIGQKFSVISEMDSHFKNVLLKTR